jgi:acetyltransferase
MHKPLTGKNIAIITHAGGPAVMLTDALSKGGLEIPHLEHPELLSKLFAGSSVANPIDFLATGTAEQLGYIIDACENDFDNIDGMAVIFGSPGLFEVYDVYKLLDEKMRSCKKPIFPILPSIINVSNEINYFTDLGRINFPDEVIFGNALCKVFQSTLPEKEPIYQANINTTLVRSIIDHSENGYLHPEQVSSLLDAAGIPRAGEAVVSSKETAIKAASDLGLPVVMKVVGPVHKSDVGGVALNVNTFDKVADEFDRMIKIPETIAILIQPMLSGHSVYIGAKKEAGFGHMVLCGLGGIYIEILKDVQSALVPVSVNEARLMIKNLKSYKIIEGSRGQEGIDQTIFSDIITRVSALCLAAPEIFEMDINPLIGNSKMLKAVDARIRIEK